MDYRERFRQALEEVLWNYESVEVGMTTFLVKGLTDYDRQRAQGGRIDPGGFVKSWIKDHHLANK